MRPKAAIRKEMLALRKSMAQAVRSRVKEQINRLILDSKQYKQADILLCYAAHGSEIGVDSLIADALECGKTVCFPRCSDENGNMRFYRVTSLSQLKEGMYGITEPDEVCAEQTEFTKRSLCLVPGVSFDVNGYRIGYGKGYYDRFLGTFSGVTVGICPDILFYKQQTWEYDRYDVAVHFVVTEQEVWQIQKQ